MFRKVFALGLVAAASAAGTVVPGSMRLRGGGFSDLAALPGASPTPSTDVIMTPARLAPASCVCNQCSLGGRHLDSASTWLTAMWRAMADRLPRHTARNGPIH